MMDNLEVLEVNHRIRRSMWSGRKMGVGVKIGIIRSGNIVSGGRIIGEIWGEMVLGVENIVVVVNEGVWSERVWQKFSLILFSTIVELFHLGLHFPQAVVTVYFLPYFPLLVLSFQNIPLFGELGAFLALQGSFSLP